MSDTKIFVKILHLSGCMTLHVDGRFLRMDAHNLRVTISNPKIVILLDANVRKRHSFGTDEHVTMDPGVASNIRS